VGISPVSYSPSQLKVSSKLKPSQTRIKLCSMTRLNNTCSKFLRNIQRSMKDPPFISEYTKITLYESSYSTQAVTEHAFFFKLNFCLRRVASCAEKDHMPRHQQRRMALSVPGFLEVVQDRGYLVIDFSVYN
jgi:hypothetical protein